MNTIRFNLIFKLYSVCLLSFFLIIGCTNADKADIKGLDITSKKIIATVDGKPIYEGDVFRRIKAVYGNVERSALPLTRWQMMIEAATETEIIETLLLKAATEEGMTVSSTELDSALAKSKEIMGEKNFKDMLKERNVTEQEFRTFLEERELIDAYKTKLFSTISIDNSAAKDYYEGHKDKFMMKDSARLEIMVIDDQQKATDIYKRWKEGETFDALSEVYSKTEKQTVGRRLRFTPYDVMPIEIQPRVREGNAGDILGPIQSDGTFYVIKILEKRIEGVMEYEQAHEMVRESLRMSKEQKVLDEWYASQIHTVTIEYVKQ